MLGTRRKIKNDHDWIEYNIEKASVYAKKCPFRSVRLIECYVRKPYTPTHHLNNSLFSREQVEADMPAAEAVLLEEQAEEDCREKTGTESY